MRRVVIGLVGLGVVLSLVGCTTAEQDTIIRRIVDRYEKAEAAAFSAKGKLENFLGDYEALKAKAEAVRTAVTEGRIPTAEGMALLAEIEARKDTVSENANAVRADFESLKAEAKGAKADLEELRNQGVPWYVIAGRILGVVITGGSSLAALALKKKAGFLSTAVGILSRAGDALGHNEYGPKVAEEIAKADGMTSAEMRPLHHLATDNSI